VKPFSPIASGKGSLDKQSADDIVNEVNDAIGFTISEDVQGHDILSCVPFDRRKVRVEELSNSRPLLHWMALMVPSN
jgi:hypothetical protein